MVCEDRTPEYMFIINVLHQLIRSTPFQWSSIRFKIILGDQSRNVNLKRKEKKKKTSWNISPLVPLLTTTTERKSKKKASDHAGWCKNPTSNIANYQWKCTHTGIYRRIQIKWCAPAVSSWQIPCISPTSLRFEESGSALSGFDMDKASVSIDIGPADDSQG